MKAAFLIGRAIFGGFFLYNGIHHFQEVEGMSQYAASKNLPSPELAVIASGVALTVGGASMITGWKPKWGSLALLSFLGTASPLFHNFWDETDPQAKQNQLIHFSKNVALLGAALALMGVEEPWPASLGRS